METGECILFPLMMVDRAGESFIGQIELSNNSGFHLRVESNLHLLWFCITMLSDLLKKLAPLSRPITSKTKTNCDLLKQAFLYFE